MCMTVAREVLKKHNEADVLFPSVKSYQQLETAFLPDCRFNYDHTNNHCYQKEETQSIPKKRDKERFVLFLNQFHLQKKDAVVFC